MPRLDAAGNAIRKPFPGNVIPKNLLNPIALAVTKYMPLPNQAAPPGSAYASSNLSIPSFFDKDKFYNLILKFDANIGSKHRAFFRHLSNDRTEDRAVNGIDNKPGTDGQQPFQRINDGYVADWTTTVSPTLLFDVRASYNRFIEKGFGRANDGFDLTSLGISKSLLAQLPSPQYFGLWQFTSTRYQNLGRYQSNNFINTYQLQGNVTKVAGSHTIKAGIDARQINYLQQNTGNILQYQGDTTWTQRSNINGDSTSGRSLCHVPAGHRERIFQLPVVSLVETAVYGALRERRLEGFAPPDPEPRPSLRHHTVRAREMEPA